MTSTGMTSELYLLELYSGYLVTVLLPLSFLFDFFLLYFPKINEFQNVSTLFSKQITCFCSGSGKQNFQVFFCLVYIYDQTEHGSGIVVSPMW